MRKIGLLSSLALLAAMTSSCEAKKSSLNSEQSERDSIESKANPVTAVKDELVKIVQMATPSNNALFAIRSKESGRECWYSAPLDKVDNSFQLRKYVVDTSQVMRLNTKELDSGEVNNAFAAEYLETAEAARRNTNALGLGVVAGATMTAAPLAIAGLGTVLTGGLGIVLFIPAGAISAVAGVATLAMAGDLFIFNPMREARAAGKAEKIEANTDFVRKYDPSTGAQYKRISQYLYDRNVAAVLALNEPNNRDESRKTCAENPFPAQQAE
jgi:hypothetical protein